MSYEKVVAVYDTEESVDAAVKSLRAAGYLTDDISIIRNEGEAAKAGIFEPGIWRRLFGRELENVQATVLSRSMKDGSVIVSVRVPTSEAPKVLDLLDSHKPVDVVDRARAYGLVGTATAASTSPSISPLKDEALLRVAEEQLTVGKRVVEAGHTRVRRYVIEKAVEATVSLHEEHAEILRRAISDPAYAADIDWSDKTIDVTETAEEPVLSKTTRITEEVVIRRQGSDHTETVHDKVRRQQVDVDRVPVGTGTKKSA
jgi:uncharacterized protein (TIGR02271 family)